MKLVINAIGICSLLTATTLCYGATYQCPAAESLTTTKQSNGHMFYGVLLQDGAESNIKLSGLNQSKGPAVSPGKPYGAMAYYGSMSCSYESKNTGEGQITIGMNGVLADDASQKCHFKNSQQPIGEIPYCAGSFSECVVVCD